MVIGGVAEIGVRVKVIFDGVEGNTSYGVITEMKPYGFRMADDMNRNIAVFINDDVVVIKP